MSTIFFSDLDERPYLIDRVIELFSSAGPGRHHAVCGEPRRMGMPPTAEDFTRSMGVLLALEDGHLSGALCLCPYSDEQVTLWGPVSVSGFDDELSNMLLARAKEALKKNQFESFRVLIDGRNRQLNNFFVNNGLQVFQKNILFSLGLNRPADLPLFQVQVAREPHELKRVQEILNESFPENGHCSEDLSSRIKQGYIHYILHLKNKIFGTAVISRDNARSWLSLIAIDTQQRGKSRSRHLLNGVINCEYGNDQKEISLEVLANNKAALALYENCGFEKQWEATILTGPI